MGLYSGWREGHEQVSKKNKNLKKMKKVISDSNKCWFLRAAPTKDHKFSSLKFCQCLLSQFWGQKVIITKARFLLKLLEKNPPLPLAGSGGFRRSLACSSITPTTASVSRWPSLWVSLGLLLLLIKATSP